MITKFCGVMCLICLVLVQLTGNVTGLNSNITNWLAGGFAMFAIATVLAAVTLKPGQGGIGLFRRRSYENQPLVMLQQPQQDNGELLAQMNQMHHDDLELLQAMHQQDMELVQGAMAALDAANARQAATIDKALDIFERISQRDKETVLAAYDFGFRISQTGPAVLSLPANVVDAVGVREVELTDDQIAAMRAMQEVSKETQRQRRY